MKQFLTAVLLSMALAFGQQAEAQQLRYYYYPASNAYYDVANQAYIYPSGGTWVTRGALPSRLAVLGSDRVVVYSATPQVWRYNATHKAKYKGKSSGALQGKAVGYKGTHPNKAQDKAGAPKGKAKGKN
ncbi:MAG TPA: hypothetical protein VGE66_14245 [Chitinophagaceae bacterium]